jgi:hypothetical protein
MTLRYSGALKLALTFNPVGGEYRVLASWVENPGTDAERRRHKTVYVPVCWQLSTPQRDLDLAAATAIRSSPLLSAAAEISPERGVHVHRTA